MKNRIDWAAFRKALEEAIESNEKHLLSCNEEEYGLWMESISEYQEYIDAIDNEDYELIFKCFSSEELSYYMS